MHRISQLSCSDLLDRDSKAEGGPQVYAHRPSFITLSLGI